MFWLPLLLSAGQGILSAQGQKANADAINRAQRRYEKLNFTFASEDLVQTYAALAARRSQDRKVLSDSLDQVTLDATRRIGAASVAGGESGVHGNSTEALINDFKITQLHSQQNIQDTERFAQEQYGRDVESARTQAMSRILTGQQTRAPQPDYMQIFLNATANYLDWSKGMKAANSYDGKIVTNQNTPQHNPTGPGGLDLPDMG